MALELGIILSLASLSKDVYNLLKKENHLKEINKTYKTALKIWCKNDPIREKIADRFKNLSDLTDHIQENGKLPLIDCEYASFLVVWETELKNNVLTYNYLIEILGRQAVSIGKDILSGQETISGKISDIGSNVTQGFDEVKQILDQLTKSTSALNIQSLTIHPQFTPPQYGKIEDYIR